MRDKNINIIKNTDDIKRKITNLKQQSKQYIERCFPSIFIRKFTSKVTQGDLPGDLVVKTELPMHEVCV